MFWRKKSKGFDWHKHVRTTIKIRREARRQKIDDAVGVAVGGVKDAGRAGVSASAASLDALNRVISAPILWGSKAIGTTMNALTNTLGWAFTPAGRVTERRGFAPMLALIATIAGFLGMARARVDGWDPIALVLTIGAIAGFIVLVGPPIFAGRGPIVLTEFAARVQQLIRRLPGASAISQTAQRGITAGALLLALVAGGFLAGRAISALPPSTLAAIPGMSRPVAEGAATAIAGDGLRIANQTIRLAGIDAPEPEQTCGDGQSRERRWKCGDAARSALRDAVRGKALKCDIAGSDDRGVKLATCKAGDTDIAAELVTRGHVFAQPGIFSTYGRQEQEARNAKRGVWKGTSERPTEYRSRFWDLAKKSAPQGCPIKAQIKRNEKVYVVPWSPQYRGVTIRQDRGERWFCSEAEAQAAGWRPSAARRDPRSS